MRPRVFHAVGVLEIKLMLAVLFSDRRNGVDGFVPTDGSVTAGLGVVKAGRQ